MYVRYISRLADKQTIQTIDFQFSWLDILKFQALFISFGWST